MRPAYRALIESFSKKDNKEFKKPKLFKQPDWYSTVGKEYKQKPKKLKSRDSFKRTPVQGPRPKRTKIDPAQSLITLGF